MAEMDYKVNIYKKYEKESSKLRMIPGGAWTINLDKVNLNNIAFVIYETKENIYSISSKKANEVGIKSILGNENKLVIPIKEWDIVKKEK